MHVALLLLSQAALALSLSANKWGYGVDDGPDKWGSFASTCSSGKKQSPVALAVKDATEDTALGMLTFTGYDAPPMAMKVENNGHTLSVTTNGTMTISNGGLNGTYQVSGFHFHWGSDNTKGSEHTLDGSRYPAELHIVHYLSSASDVTSAMSMPDGLAVLGFMLDGGGGKQATLDKLLSVFASDKSEGHSEWLSAPFALNDLLPTNREKFLRYKGSLTTPGCNEVVTWTVFISTIQVADSQLAILRELKYNDTNGTQALQDNYRPLQSLNGRKIKANFKKTGGTGGAAGSYVSLGPLGLLLCLFHLR